MKTTPFPQRVVAHLDEGSEHLPYRITHRLDQARAQAVALAQRKAVAQSPAQSAPSVSSDATAVLAGGPSGSSLWFKFLSFLPVVLIAVGFLTITYWDEIEKAAETADLDEALLIDEIPIEAYADKGFGVFIKNTLE